MNPPSGAKPSHEIVSLTALRGWLAWWVVLLHLGPLFSELFPLLPKALVPGTSGSIAVDVFFILSGFVMGLAYEDKFAVGEFGQYLRFLWARLARIYPTHIAQQLAWACLVITAAALGKPGFTRASLQADGFVRSALLIHSWGAPITGQYWNYPAWSISLEWAAYLSTPLLFVLLRSLKVPNGRISVATLAIATFVLTASVQYLSSYPASHFARIGCEYFGGLLLAARFNSSGSPPSVCRLTWIWLILFVAAASVTHAAGHHAFWALPLAGLAVFGLAADKHTYWALGSKFSVYQGRVSYSIYMSHALTITLLHQVLHPRNVGNASVHWRLLVVIAYVVSIFVIGVCTFHLVETPCRRLMQNFLRHNRDATSVAATP